MTKIVLPKVEQIFMVSNCTCWPRELYQKGVSFFPHNIQYRARLKGPHFQLFRHYVTFFGEKIPQRFPASIFLEFCNRMDVEKSQTEIPNVQKIFFTKGSPFNFFWGFATEWMKNLKASPWSANSVQILGFSGVVEGNTLALWSPFAIFEP